MSTSKQWDTYVVDKMAYQLTSFHLTCTLSFCCQSKHIHHHNSKSLGLRNTKFFGSLCILHIADLDGVGRFLIEINDRLWANKNKSFQEAQNIAMDFNRRSGHPFRQLSCRNCIILGFVLEVYWLLYRLLAIAFAIAYFRIIVQWR